MRIQDNFVFASEVSAPVTSKELMNAMSDTLTLHISGDATSFALTLQGQSDLNAPFVDLFGVSIGGTMESMNAYKQITTKGIYAYDISGVVKVRAVITAVSGGSLTVFGKTTSGV